MGRRRTVRVIGRWQRLMRCPTALGSRYARCPWCWRLGRGITLTQGAITQDALRRATGEIGEAYACLRAAVPERPVHPADTGGRVGGGPASLRAFDTDEVTVSQIRSPHRQEEVQEGIPRDYAGVMVTDRGQSYGTHACNVVPRQKCLAHILRSSSDVVATKKSAGEF